MSETFLQRCEKIIGSENVDLKADPPLFCPDGEQELCEIVRNAYSGDHKIIVTGAGTYPLSCAIPHALHVSTRALSSIKEVSPGDYLMVVQSGCVVDEAVGEAEKYGLFLTLDITSGDSATVGGAYMTGAVGLSSLKYGPFSKSVIGVRCVTAQGDSVTFGGRTTKNVTGYDVTRFLAGTMGIYGLALDVTIKLQPFPELRLIASGGFKRQAELLKAVNTLSQTFRNASKFELVATEGLGWETQLGIGFDGIDFLVKRDIQKAKNIMADTGAVSVGDEHPRQFMAKRRKAGRKIADSGLFTFSLPPMSSGVFLEKISMISQEIPLIGHLLTGRFHILCTETAMLERITETALAIGGKLPVEWGYAAKKGISGLFTGPELEIARAIKRELDPKGIFNPHMRLL